MNWGKAFLAGIVGAVAMTIMLSIAIFAGFRVLDFSMMWGTLVGLPKGGAAWMAGFLIHLLVGGLFALIYAALFKAFSGAGLLRGCAFGVVHALITGVLIALLPLVHPLMSTGRMVAPGPYFSGRGIAGILFYFAIHIVYGGTVGWLYARLVPAARQIPQNDNLRIAA
jgi:hypothetical protein